MNSVFVIWDENDGYNMARVYADEKTANFALKLKYTEYWIIHGKATVKEVPIVRFED